MARFLAAAAVLAGLVPARAGDDEELARARADFEAVVQCDVDDRLCVAGPSLTTLVRRVLAHGPDVVRRVEAEMWEASKRDDLVASKHAAEIERLVRFLHGMEQNGRGGRWRTYELRSGVVVEVAEDGFYSGPEWRPTPGSFEQAVGTRPLLALSAPSPTALLAAVAALDERRLDDVQLAATLGESCAEDDAGFAELSRRWTTALQALAGLEGVEDAAERDQRKLRAKDVCEFYALALGWTRRPQAVDVLVAYIAKSPDHRDPYALESPAFALHHADPAEFDRVVAALGRPQGDRLAALVGGAPLVRRLLDGLTRTRTHVPDRVATLHFCAAASRFHHRIRGAETRRILRALLDATRSADPDVRRAALEAASDVLMAAPSVWTGRTSGSGRSFDGTEAHVWVGQTAWIGDLLPAVVEDLESGRLVALDEPPKLLAAKPGAPWPELARAQQAAAPGCVIRDFVPVHLSAEKTADGWRLRLRNVGDGPLAVDPVSLRYADADDVSVSRRTADGSKVSERRLRLRLGGLRLSVVVPADRLLILVPGSTHEWTLKLRNDLREFDHLEAAIVPRLDVVGPADAPLVRFWTTSIL